MENESAHLPLHKIHINKLETAINRAHTLLHSILLLLFLTLRIHQSHTLPHLLLFLAELFLSLIWLSEQPFRWSPIHRTPLLSNLPMDPALLPGLDVFICTADPDKEPTVEVMNTVVSAMALDYPKGKLHVYLSDDGGAGVTLGAVKEAWVFASWWVPFCEKYGVGSRCPMAYFEELRDGDYDGDGDFVADRLKLVEKYEMFKHRVEMNLLQGGVKDSKNRANHPPIVQLINENCTDASLINPDCTHLPLLVYVSREKRPSHPHHFKAGALNVLLRVSAMLSNSPVTLMLDCDMYCNDPTSAKQAMCFYLDPHVSPSLAFVQFPQRYHNLRDNDIYDGGLRWCFKVLLQGMDGLNTGPLMCGTGLFLNRKAIYNPCNDNTVDLRNNFGPSNEFIRSVSQRQSPDSPGKPEKMVLQEAKFVASCSYEEGTKWGDGVGFYYYSIAEDVLAGYHLHIGGWKSVYVDPHRAPFLGTCTTNFNVFLAQNTRWIAGLVEIGLSQFFPFVYRPSRRHLSLALRMCYAWTCLYATACIPVLCLAFIPQLCLFHGIPVFPKVSSSLLASLIFISSLLKNLHEVLTTGGTVLTWWNEYRTWTLKMVACNVYGCIDAMMKTIGVKNTCFIPTSKVTDEEQEERYRLGIYDFRTSNMFLVLLGTAVILNLVSFVAGLVRILVVGNWEVVIVEVIISGMFVVMSKPVIEGMVVRRDEGRFPTLATLMSLGACSVLIVLGHVMLVQ